MTMAGDSIYLEEELFSEDAELEEADLPDDDEEDWLSGKEIAKA